MAGRAEITSMTPQAHPQRSAIKVTARDWKAIPAHLKYVVGGVQRVLTKAGFVDVVILN